MLHCKSMSCDKETVAGEDTMLIPVLPYLPQAIGIPFAHIDPSALLRMELSPESTIYVNCPSSFPREAALKLAKFVEEGGQLITTDWALKHVLEAAFPGTVKVAGSTGDEVVAVEIVDKEDEVLKGKRTVHGIYLQVVN